MKSNQIKSKPSVRRVTVRPHARPFGFVASRRLRRRRDENFRSFVRVRVASACVVVVVVVVTRVSSASRCASTESRTESRTDRSDGRTDRTGRPTDRIRRSRSVDFVHHRAGPERGSTDRPIGSVGGSTERAGKRTETGLVRWVDRGGYVKPYGFIFIMRFHTRTCSVSSIEGV